MNNTVIFYLIQILISEKFENKIVFESSVLAWIRIRNRIRINQKCWIRIRIKSIRIHNSDIFIIFFEKFGVVVEIGRINLPTELSK
jgi:hypothetical protein